MSTTPSPLPRLLVPPPPPRFPQQFSERDSELDGNENVNGMRVGEGEGEESAGRVGNRIDWQIKTEAEQHVQRLEEKLVNLSKRASNADFPSTANEDLPTTLSMDDYEESGEMDDRGEERISEDGVEGEAAGHADEERALLSIAEDEHDLGKRASTEFTETQTEEDDNEADLSGNEDFETAQDRQRRALQRISFSNSVRISGGIRSSTRPHRHRPTIIDHFPRRSPSAERSNPFSRADPRPEATPSPLLVASVTSSTANTPSRATSPAGRTSSPHTSLGVLVPRPRRLSSSSQTFATGPFSVYSASPGSQVPSRGSSPCSSIYAPLQPPSKHTPSPRHVRPSQRLQRQRSSSGLSFQDYLREGYDAIANSEEDDSDAIVVPKPQYRDLVDQQRRKRAKWEERRRRKEEEKRRRLLGDEDENDREGGFWSSVKKLFAMSSSHGAGAGRAGGAFGSPTVFRHSTRLPSNANYGSTSSSQPPSSSPLAAPPKPRSILASTQPSPTSTATSSRPPSRLTPPRPQSTSPSKSELDDQFGQTPYRYFTFAFLVYNLSRLWQAIQDLFSTASKGLAKQKERERLARQRQGYEAV